MSGDAAPAAAVRKEAAALRVVICIASLEGGGAERVAATLAGQWASRGRDVSMVTFADPGETPFSVPPGVSHVPLGLASPSGSAAAAVLANVRRVLVLRRCLARLAPDVVVSFVAETNVLCVLATRGLRVPLIVCEHSDPLDWPLERRWERLRRLTYRRATRAVALTRRGAAAVGERYRVPCVRIPNPLPADARPADAPGGGDGRRLLAVGRLSAEKRHDRLIATFATLHESRPDWRLVIAGDGPEAAALRRQVAALGLADAVELPGRTGDPWTLMRACDLFVHTSRTEAFPMAVCEAMACGLPVVVMEYNEGVHEIVEHGVDGIVVGRDDFTALDHELARLMDDPAARGKLAAAAPRIRERLSLARVDREWDALLAALTARPAGDTHAGGADC